MKPADRRAEKSGDTKLKNGCVRTECVIIVGVDRGGGGEETDDERNMRLSPSGVVMHVIDTRALA